MRKRPLAAKLVLVLAVAVLVAWTEVAQAAPVTLLLTTTTALTNIDDAAGRWQFDGGTVVSAGVAVGNFTRVKRIVFGANNLNTATLTITIFFPGSDPPETITLQGSHSFNNGREKGSISGASGGLAGAVGITFEGPSNALTFDVP